MRIHNCNRIKKTKNKYDWKKITGNHKRDINIQRVNSNNKLK